jgi:hypothetical protein
MAQTFKILQGYDKVEKDQWFRLAANSMVNMRQASGPLNLVKPRANLEVRSNFFSVRVVDELNGIPTEINMAKNPHQFKKMYTAHRRSHAGM